MRTQDRRTTRLKLGECMPTVYPSQGGYVWTCEHGGPRRGLGRGRRFTRRSDAVYASVQHWRRMSYHLGAWS